MITRPAAGKGEAEHLRRIFNDVRLRQYRAEIRGVLGNRKDAGKFFATSLFTFVRLKPKK